MLEELFKEMYQIASNPFNNIPLQVGDTWCHSIHVYAYAKKIADIADQVMRIERKIDQRFLLNAAFVHDLGRMKTGSNASRKVMSYERHGIEGRNHILTNLNMICTAFGISYTGAKKYANVCVSHQGGPGFIAKTNIKLGIGYYDTLAQTIEERIIGYADWRTHAKHIGGSPPTGIYIPFLAPEEKAMEKTKEYEPYPEQLEAVIALCKYIHYITNNNVPDTCP